MVTTHSSTRPVAPGLGYDGVVRISAGGYYGTGMLLYGGRAVLTAAHVVEGAASDEISVLFETRSGTQTVGAELVRVHPDYDTANENNDVALVWLSSSAPQDAERYELYRQNDELGQVATMVGYGCTGTGRFGYVDTEDSWRVMAQNSFDADAATLKAVFGTGMSWSPRIGTQLLADFDNGLSAQDALGQFLDVVDYGLGAAEGLIAPGDSGGPAFISGQVAGIASYTTSLRYGSSRPDIDHRLNSSFGEIGAWQRVGAYQEWIDQSLRAEYTDVPSSPSQVLRSVNEGDAGTTIAYFLLQFTSVREDPKQILTVDYATRDGSAKAGEDYLAVRGTLVLYPDEIQAVIPVEIIGDTRAEVNETFFLDVTNPAGGSFGDGVVRLTAMRTIVDDDWA